MRLLNVNWGKRRTISTTSSKKIQEENGTSVLMTMDKIFPEKPHTNTHRNTLNVYELRKSLFEKMARIE